MAQIIEYTTFAARRARVAACNAADYAARLYLMAAEATLAGDEDNATLAFAQAEAFEAQAIEINNMLKAAGL